MTLSFPFTPPQTAKMLLQALPAKRMREVLERRFGLKGGEAQTLDAIGKSYKITRERVRQIEADALRRLRASQDQQLEYFFEPVETELQKHGGVMAERHLYEGLALDRHHPHLRLLLRTAPQFSFFAESDKYHGRWATSDSAASGASEILERAVARLDEAGRPVNKEMMYRFLSADEGSQYRIQDEAIAEAHLRISRIIARNPYGEYGLISWPAISPRGIKDKAYAALVKSGEPTHFRNVASAIDRVGWAESKKAHPQTVHNELIKDGRFILVGRGLYALKEWGYEPGTVREVLTSLLKANGRPLGREEIVKLASEKRLVKPQTILLNLQDRTLFRRTEDGKYTLA